VRLYTDFQLCIPAEFDNSFGKKGFEELLRFHFKTIPSPGSSPLTGPNPSILETFLKVKNFIIPPKQITTIRIIISIQLLEVIFFSS